MSAAVLREAAALMQARAEAATPGRWKLWGMTVMADQDGTNDVATALLVARTTFPGEGGPLRTWNATHIASWHPAVALAVADLLDDGADYMEWVETTHPEAVDPKGLLLLAVANAYLGRDDA